MSRARLLSCGLTVQQERFAVDFIKHGCASEAYRNTYNVGDSTKPATVWKNAHKLLRSAKVASRVSQLYAMLMMEHEAIVNVERLTREFECARQKAMDEGKPAAAVAATMSKARLHGLLDGKRPMVKRPEEMTDEELAFVLEGNQELACLS